MDNVADPKAFVLSHSYSIRSNLLNEFCFGHNRQTTLVTYPKFPDGAKLVSDLGLQQLGPFPKGSAFPYFEFDGASGLEIRELRSADFESFTAADNFGDYYFSGKFTGYDFADFLLGLPSFIEVVNAGPEFDGHARAYGFFGQDGFKVKLTRRGLRP